MDELLFDNRINEKFVEEELIKSGFEKNPKISIFGCSDGFIKFLNPKELGYIYLKDKFYKESEFKNSVFIDCHHQKINQYMTSDVLLEKRLSTKRDISDFINKIERYADYLESIYNIRKENISKNKS